MTILGDNQNPFNNGPYDPWSSKDPLGEVERNFNTGDNNGSNSQTATARSENKEDLPVEGAQQAPEEKVAEDVLQLELKSLDDMMNSKCEFRNILSQIYKVMLILHRLGCREDKSYALDKEIEMQVEIKKIKESYNSWPVLVITCISGGLTIAGGVVGIFGAFPGTAVGDALGKLPAMKSFFDVSGAADKAKKASELATKISSFSSGLSSVGQGTGAFGKLFENKDEANRAVLQFALQQMQRKNEDRTRSSGDEGQQGRDAIRNLSQIESEAHNTASRMLDSRG